MAGNQSDGGTGGVAGTENAVEQADIVIELQPGYLPTKTSPNKYFFIDDNSRVSSFSVSRNSSRKRYPQEDPT